jgi:hypothetical protein
MEVSSQLHAPVALPPGKEPRLLVGYEAELCEKQLRIPGEN